MTEEPISASRRCCCGGGSRGVFCKLLLWWRTSCRLVKAMAATAFRDRVYSWGGSEKYMRAAWSEEWHNDTTSI